MNRFKLPFQGVSRPGDRLKHSRVDSCNQADGYEAACGHQPNRKFKLQNRRKSRAKQIAKVKSFQVLESRSISENETVLTLYIDGLEGSEKTPRMKMQRINNEWRLAGPYHAEESKQQQ